MIRCGQGFDAHRFAAGRPLVLGGETIHYEYGLSGHSDADALTHAVIDSVLGALAIGDIGGWFPDTDPKHLNANSLTLLEKVLGDPLLSEWAVVNLDATVIAQKPRLADYIPAIRRRLAGALRCDVGQVSVKAKTTEGMGFCGREEGIAAMANVLLRLKK